MPMASPTLNNATLPGIGAPAIHNLTSPSSTESKLVFPPLPIALVSSNCVPDLEEEKSFRKVVKQREMELELLDVELRRLDGLRAQIQLQHDETTENLRQLRSIVSVVRQLPAEILSQIFLDYMDNADVELLGAVSSNPWALSQVCSRWRDVALSTGQLWCDFVLPPLHHETLTRWSQTRSNKANSSDILSLGVIRSRLLSCITRSADSLLDFRFILCPIMPSDIFEILGSASHRWKNVTLCFCFGDGAFSLPAKIKGNLPNLQTLSLRFRPEQPFRFPDYLDTFEDAPLLSSLCLDGIHLPTMQWQFPWSQITVLHLDAYVNPKELYVILSQANILEVLKLQLGESECEIPFPIALPRLHTLIVKKTTDVVQCSIFDRLTTPQLTDLFLCFPPNAEALTSSVLEFLTRSHCQLKILTLEDCPLLAFLAIAQKAPSISSCMLIPSGFSNVMITRLVESIVLGLETFFPKFPHLEHISVEGDDDSISSVIKILTERASLLPPTASQYLRRIVFNGNWTEDDYERVCRLNQEQEVEIILTVRIRSLFVWQD